MLNIILFETGREELFYELKVQIMTVCIIHCFSRKVARNYKSKPFYSNTF